MPTRRVVAAAIAAAAATRACPTRTRVRTRIRRAVAAPVVNGDVQSFPIMDSSSHVPPAPGSSGRGGASSEQHYSLAWTLDPFPIDRFFAEYWEQKTLLVSRKQRDYYTG